MWQGFVKDLRDLFTKRCRGCESKDQTIQMLREELREEKLRVSEVLTMLGERDKHSEDINKHLLHMNIVSSEPSGENKPFKTKPHGIMSRIRTAELSAVNETESVKRRKAYEERVENILNPKVQGEELH